MDVFVDGGGDYIGVIIGSRAEHEAVVAIDGGDVGNGRCDLRFVKRGERAEPTSRISTDGVSVKTFTVWELQN